MKRTAILLVVLLALLALPLAGNGNETVTVHPDGSKTICRNSMALDRNGDFLIVADANHPRPSEDWVIDIEDLNRIGKDTIRRLCESGRVCKTISEKKFKYREQMADKKVSWKHCACEICGKTIWEKKIKHKNTQADLRRVEAQLKEYMEQVKNLQKQLEDMRRKLPRDANYVEASVNLPGRIGHFFLDK